MWHTIEKVDSLLSNNYKSDEFSTAEVQLKKENQKLQGKEGVRQARAHGNI